MYVLYATKQVLKPLSFKGFTPNFLIKFLSSKLYFLGCKNQDFYQLCEAGGRHFF